MQAKAMVKIKYNNNFQNSKFKKSLSTYFANFSGSLLPTSVQALYLLLLWMKGKTQGAGKMSPEVVKQSSSLGEQARVSSRTSEGTEFLTRTTLREHSRLIPDVEVTSKKCFPAYWSALGEKVPSERLSS